MLRILNVNKYIRMEIGIYIVLAFIAGFLLDYFISEKKIKVLEERIEALEHLVNDLIEFKNNGKIN